MALAPDLDASALIGWEAAEELTGDEVPPSTLYERSEESAVEEGAELLPATVNPELPSEVVISGPSDALAAQEAADETLTTLLLALGGVSLLVGGIGMASTMVIAVLERRSEIALRRALGATRAHIRRQFLGESVLLAGLGGIGGALIGGGVTMAFAASREWPFALPLWVLGGAAGATVPVVAYPAARMPRPPPCPRHSGGPSPRTEQSPTDRVRPGQLLKHRSAT
ncbi:ABC transporter permease [Streptomyces sp. PT12]|uniref:ABC transporter permease n=1 Tax=Streptomyces sp. PT12 TaxID=1510197 RepID=UPI001C670BE9|nr:ABC transporter permease [Streptomyces sp. PT12]